MNIHSQTDHGWVSEYAVKERERREMLQMMRVPAARFTTALTAQITADLERAINNFRKSGRISAKPAKTGFLLLPGLTRKLEFMGVSLVKSSSSYTFHCWSLYAASRTCLAWTGDLESYLTKTAAH